MREQHTHTEDLPFIQHDRRRIPDRRAKWRGGRRDSDWTNRRPVSFNTLTALSPVRRWGFFGRPPAKPVRPAQPAALWFGLLGRRLFSFLTVHSRQSSVVSR